MERLIFGILRYVASYDGLNTLDVSSFQAMFFYCQNCNFVMASHEFQKGVFFFYFLPEHAVTAASRHHMYKSFLSPNGNCSPISSISLSWSSAIHRFFPRRRPRDNGCYRDHFCLSFSECFQIILWRVQGHVRSHFQAAIC